MVISQPPGNNPSYYYRASPTLPQLLWIETPYVLYMQLSNIRVTHRNGAISIFFIMNQIHEGSSADCSLFILSLHALALHLWLKYYLNLSVWRFEHVASTYICRLYFSRKPAGTALCYATNTIKWKTFLIFDINHQQTQRWRSSWLKR